MSYVLLGFWTFVVLFPLYWVAITSFKLPIDVNDGPFYLPCVDFQPSLDAWQYLFGTMLGDTLRPYLNTVIVALVQLGHRRRLRHHGRLRPGPPHLPAARRRHPVLRRSA